MSKQENRIHVELEYAFEPTILIGGDSVITDERGLLLIPNSTGAVISVTVVAQDLAEALAEADDRASDALLDATWENDWDSLPCSPFRVALVEIDATIAYLLGGGHDDEDGDLLPAAA